MITHLQFYEAKNRKFSFKSEIDEETRSLEIPKMSLQPLIENCFAHSFSDMQGGWEIGITSYYYDNYYVIVISDSGIGTFFIIFFMTKPLFPINICKVEFSDDYFPYLMSN